MSTSFTYCPKCKSDMAMAPDGYNHCQSDSCSYIQYDNPTPVVAAIVEYGEDQVILAHNAAWPPGWYGLITGFLEKGEHPDECVLREVKEELNLDGELMSMVGMYTFKRMNQLIIAYHIKTKQDPITLDPELDDYKIVPFSKVKYWPAGTGYALRDFLLTRGIEAEMRPFS